MAVRVRAHLGDHEVTGTIGEIDVEQPGIREARCERDREKTPLPARRDEAGDVGEGRALAPPQQPDPPTALDDDRAGDTRGRGHKGRAVESADPLQLDPGFRLGEGDVQDESPEGRERDCDGQAPHWSRR
jgi:hypothetical protein